MHPLERRAGDPAVDPGERGAGGRPRRAVRRRRGPDRGRLADQPAPRPDHPGHPGHRLHLRRHLRPDPPGAGRGRRPGPGRRRGALPDAAHPRQRRTVPGVLPRRRARARHPDELGRRAQPGRRDRVVPAGRLGGRRPDRPALRGRPADAPALPDRAPGRRAAGPRGIDAAGGGVRPAGDIGPGAAGGGRRAAAHRGPLRPAADDDPADRAGAGAPAGPAGPVRRPAGDRADPHRGRADGGRAGRRDGPPQRPGPAADRCC